MATYERRAAKSVAADAVATQPMLRGRYLYVGGSDIFNRLNQPAQRLPVAWARHVERLDVVGYRPFYDGPPAAPLKRLWRGLRSLWADRVRVREDVNVRHIDVRLLRLPGLIDALFGDVWIYANLRARLAPFYEVAIVYAPESALLARQLMRARRVGMLIYHDIDFYPYVSRDWRQIVAWRERLAVRTADAVISVSRPLVRLRQQQGARRVLYLPNGVNVEQFAPAILARQPGPPALIYVGTLDLRWGVDLPIRALPALLKRLPEVHLFIVGTGPAEAELHALVETLGLGRAITFLGLVPYEQLPSVMAKAHVGLATSRQDIFRQYACPLKLLEYMAAGLPVVASGGGEAELMIEESDGGVHIPFDPDALAEAAYDLLTDPARLDACRQAGLDYARSRSWEQLTAQLVDYLADPTKPRSSVEASVPSGANGKTLVR